MRTISIQADEANDHIMTDCSPTWWSPSPWAGRA